MRPVSYLLAAALGLALLGSGPVGASAAVAPLRSGPVGASAAVAPRETVGMNIDGPFSFPSVGPSRQLSRMVQTGVQSVRVVFDWSRAQPYPDWKAVPSGQVPQFQPGGAVPTDFTATDAIVKLSAERGLSVLPIVLYSPGWDQTPAPAGTLAIPRRDTPYAAYLRSLVGRYGPRGSFWSSNPGLPRMAIRMWQIWNEPNTHNGWPTGRWEFGYTALLRAAHRAIKRADPGARVVLAGMPNFAWRDLGKLYRAGARKLFDVVAVHPYTRTPQGAITIISRVRNVMDRHGDRAKSIAITEFGWPSSLHRTAFLDFATTEAGQAKKLASLLPLLTRDRQQLGITAFYYYTWIGDENPLANPFAYSGLLGLDHGRVVQKPAYRVFRRYALALEGCRRKSGVATRCAQPG